MREVGEARMARQFAGESMQHVELAIVRYLRVDVRVAPGRAANADRALFRRQEVHRRTRRMAHEGPGEFGTARTGGEGQHPEDVERHAAAAGRRQRRDVDLALDRSVHAVAERGEAEPVGHQRDLALAEHQAGFDAVELARIRRHGVGVRRQSADEIQGGDRLVAHEVRTSVLAERLAAARPDMNAEIIETVMAVRIESEHGSVPPRFGSVKLARDGDEFLPSPGRREPGRVEQILAVDQALRPVMVRHAPESAVELLQLEQRGAPGVGKIGNRGALEIRGQISERADLMRLGDPVGREEGDIELALPQSLTLEQAFMQRVEIKGFDLDPRVDAGGADKIPELPDDRRLERRKLANGDADRLGHGAPRSVVSPACSAIAAAAWRREGNIASMSGPSEYFRVAMTRAARTADDVPPISTPRSSPPTKRSPSTIS